jgi:hypothetical protein
MVAVGAVMVMVPVGACTETDAAAGAPEDPFCTLLAEPPHLARWMHTDVIAFVLPDTPAEEVRALSQVVKADPNVAEVRFHDHQAAYEEFLEIFADDPDMIDGVTPEILPPSLRIAVLDGGTQIGALVDHPSIFELRDRRSMGLDAPAVEQLRWLTVLPRNDREEIWDRADVGLSLNLGEHAPAGLLDDVAVLEQQWRSSGTTLDEEAVRSARRIVAYFDTECS